MLGALLFSLVSATFHFVVARWAERSFPRLRPHRKRIAMSVASFLAIAFLSRAATLAHLMHVPSSVSAFFAGEMSFVAVIALPILVAQFVIGLLAPLVSWTLARAGMASPSLAPIASAGDASPRVAVDSSDPDAPATATTPALSRRLIIERAAGLLVTSATASVFAWGTIKGRIDFETIEVVVKLTRLPRVLDGYTIAQISDLHVGTFVDDDHLRRGFEHVIKIKPDLIVATGDLVDHDPAYAKKMADALASLGAIARDGISAILGNHDHYTGANQIVHALRNSGVNILVDGGRVIRPGDGGGFALLGVDDLYPYRRRGGGPSLEHAEGDVPPDRATVLLSHQPTTVDIWAGRVDLQLSGHTHGGQINPGFSIAKQVLKYVHGRYEIKGEIRGGTTLYVNRGFGTAGIPVRVRARPEVTKIVLVCG